MDLQYTSQRAPQKISGGSLLCEGNFLHFVEVRRYIREMGKPPETPDPKPEREMGKREKKPKNQRGKWEKERRRTEERGGEPKGAPTPLSSSVKTHEFIAMAYGPWEALAVRQVRVSRIPLRPDL